MNALQLLFTPSGLRGGSVEARLRVQRAVFAAQTTATTEVALSSSSRSLDLPPHSSYVNRMRTLTVILVLIASPVAAEARSDRSWQLYGPRCFGCWTVPSVYQTRNPQPPRDRAPPPLEQSGSVPNPRMSHTGGTED